MPRFGTITDHSQLNNLAYAASGHTGFSNVVNHNDLGNLAYADAGHIGFPGPLPPLFLGPFDVISDLDSAPMYAEFGFFYRLHIPASMDITKAVIWTDLGGGAGSLTSVGVYGSDKNLLGSVLISTDLDGACVGDLLLTIPAGDAWLAIACHDTIESPYYMHGFDFTRRALGANFGGYATSCYPLPATIPVLAANRAAFCLAVF